MSNKRSHQQLGKPITVRLDASGVPQVDTPEDELLDDGVFDGTDIEHEDVCATCDNSGKIECPSCDDGFIRDDGGYMFACGGCDGEGFIDCPDCD